MKECMDQCNETKSEERESFGRKFLKDNRFDKYPWFTVLKADGTKDSSGELFYLNRGTVAIINGDVNAITGHRRENIFGSLEIVQVGNELKAKFKNCDKVMEALILDLTPSVNGKVHKSNGAFVEVIEVLAISFDFSKNCDHRIKSLRDQRNEQELENMKCDTRD